MSKLASITVLTTLIIIASAFMLEASAQDDDDPWIRVYDKNGNLCDLFYFGDTINVTAYCATQYLPFQITITAPNGTVVYTKTGINTQTWTAKFSNMTDALGDWMVELLGTGGIKPTKGYACGTYLVIPQVPLGVITALSACLTGYGLKKIHRRKACKEKE